MPHKTALLFTFFLQFYTLLAQPGQIDPTFNIIDDGTHPTAFDDQVRDAHMYPNGKYLIGGFFTTYQGQSVNSLIRLNNDGSIDLTFNDAINGVGPLGTVEGFVVLENRKIVVFGDFTHYNGLPADGIVIINEDGSKESTFNVTQAPLASIKDAAELSNGDIIIVGNIVNGSSQSQVIRITQQGTISPVFNTNVIANTNILQVEVDPYDNIYVCGQFSNIGGLVTEEIARMNANGIMDFSYSIPVEWGNNTNDIYVNDDSTVIACGSYSSSLNPPSPVNGYYKILPDGSIDNSFISANVWGHYRHIAKDSLGRYCMYWYNNQYKKIIRILPSGQEDPTFEEYTYDANGSNGNVNKILTQANGKILLAGNEFSRRNENGTNDESFLSPNGVNGTVETIQTMANSKAYIAGAFSGYNGVSRNGICRVFADGSIDVSFDCGSGVVTGVSPFESEWRIYKIAVQPDGKIIVGGDFTRFNGEDRNNLVRLLPDGSFDPSFNIGSGLNNAVKDIIILPSGKILVAGEFNQYDSGGPNQTSCGGLIKLNLDGSIDQSFQLLGQAPVEAMAMTNSGQIVLAGGFLVFDGNLVNRLCRINSDGTFDPSYNVGSGANSLLYDVIVDADDRVIVTGTAFVYDGDTLNFLFRTLPDGQRDTTYADTNQFYSSFGTNQIEFGPDSSVMLLGRLPDVFNNDLQVFRLDPNGIIDPTFQSYPTNNNAYDANAFDFTADGDIIVGGKFVEYGGIPKNGLTRIKNVAQPTGCNFLNVTLNEVTPLSCQDTSFIIANAALGTPPYQYSWDGGNYSINDTIFTTDSAGVHYLSVLDSAGCYFNTGFLITGPVTQTSFDLRTGLVATTFRPGFDSQVNIVGFNEGCVPITGTLELIHDSLLNFVSATTPPDAINGDTLVWNFVDQTFDSTAIASSVVFNVSLNAQIGDSVICYSRILPQVSDFDTTNNIFHLNDPVINGYDPNDKKVYPPGECIPHYIDLGQKLLYTVRFQNTGNASAINVQLNDSISEFLDIHSMRILHATHDMHAEVLPNNFVQFVFNDINLPDSTSQPFGSIGHIIFEIEQLPALFDETVIDNEVAIYFDFNPPIYTNEVFNTIAYEPFSSSEESITLAECDSILWNGTYYNTPGTYLYQTYNVFGCDSIATLNLSLLNSTSSVDSIVTCDSVFWNGTSYNSSGTYQWVTSNSAGCDSVVTLNLTVYSTPQETIFQNGTTLSISALNAAYQWLDCNSGYAPIPNATSENYTPTDISGSVAVMMDINGCVDTTDCFNYNFASLESFQKEEILIQPNPATTLVTITGNIGVIEYVGILSATGSWIERLELTNSVLNISHLANGIYYLELQRNGQKKYLKLVKT